MKQLAPLLTLVISLSAFSQPSQGGVNALWNDGLPGLVGLWIYPTSGGCPDLRTKAVPLVLAAKSSQAKQEVSSLSYCFKLPEGNSAMNKCANGAVQLAYEESSNQYSGNYEFEMADGTKVEGTFTAAYCPKQSK
ncbi:hypothetical protein ACFL00_04785 [Pseudomonadota bacterium]